jgi:hypothetical protein
MKVAVGYHSDCVHFGYQACDGSFRTMHLHPSAALAVANALREAALLAAQYAFVVPEIPPVELEGKPDA